MSAVVKVASIGPTTGNSFLNPNFFGFDKKGFFEADAAAQKAPEVKF